VKGGLFIQLLGMIRLKDAVADKYQWEVGLGVSRSVGSAIYLNLQDEVELWKEGRGFLPVRKNEVRRIFEFC